MLLFPYSSSSISLCRYSSSLFRYAFSFIIIPPHRSFLFVVILTRSLILYASSFTSLRPITHLPLCSLSLTLSSPLLIFRIVPHRSANTLNPSYSSSRSVWPHFSLFVHPLFSLFAHSFLSLSSARSLFILFHFHHLLFVFAPLLCFGPLTAPLIPKHKSRAKTGDDERGNERGRTTEERPGSI